MTFDLSLFDINHIFKKDLYFEIAYLDPKSSREDKITSGGIYTVTYATKKAFSSDIKVSKLESNSSDKQAGYVLQKKGASGFTTQIEKLSKIINNQLLQSQSENLDTIHFQNYFIYEAFISSDTAISIDVKMLISTVLWHIGVPTLVYPWDQDRTLTEQVELAAKMKIGLVILVKEQVIFCPFKLILSFINLKRSSW